MPSVNLENIGVGIKRSGERDFYSLSVYCQQWCYVENIILYFCVKAFPLSF